MTTRKLSVTISALILAAQLGSPIMAAEPTLEQLSRIESLLDDNDVAGLREYIKRNPELLEGESQMAQLLREFVQASDELPAYLGYRDARRSDAQGDTPGSGPGDIAPGAGGDAIY